MLLTRQPLRSARRSPAPPLFQHGCPVVRRAGGRDGSRSPRSGEVRPGQGVRWDMHQHVVVQFDGKSYTWTGKDWYETKTFLRPPSTIIRKLNARLAQDLQCADTALTSVDAILKPIRFS